MTYYTTNKYRIDIYDAQNFKKGSADNVDQYNYVYFDKSGYQLVSIFGIKIFQEETLIKSAVIGSIGGATVIHDSSTIIENDRLVLCCADSIFCLSIPELTLLWKTQADQATCFQIYKYEDSYIIHGELEISRLDRNEKILWQHGGSDIFTTLDGNENFVITKDFILATDWENRKYKFGFDGTIIE